MSRTARSTTITFALVRQYLKLCRRIITSVQRSSETQSLLASLTRPIYHRPHTSMQTEPTSVISWSEVARVRQSSLRLAPHDKLVHQRQSLRRRPGGLCRRLDPRNYSPLFG